MSFPAPPDFYKHFTEENLARHRAKLAKHAAPAAEPLQNTDIEESRRKGDRLAKRTVGSMPLESSSKVHDSDDGGGGVAGAEMSTVRMEDVEELEDTGKAPADENGGTVVSEGVDDGVELYYLEPPPPLTEGHYVMFGKSWPVVEEHPSLADVGETQLYPDGCDHVQELKKFNRSLLFNFVELLRSMTENLNGIPEHMEHLRQIFVNMHHLINEHRPHQAREDLRRLMLDQLERKRAENASLRRACEQVAETLAPSIKAQANQHYKEMMKST